MADGIFFSSGLERFFTVRYLLWQLFKTILEGAKSIPLAVLSLGSQIHSECISVDVKPKVLHVVGNYQLMN